MILTADILRLVLTTGAVVVYALTGRAHEAIAMGLIAATAWVLRTARAPPALDLSFVALLSGDAWATALGAFASFNRDDHPGHLVLSGLATAILARLASRAGFLADTPPRGRLGRIAHAATLAALGLALGGAWELVELTSDGLLGTNMSLGVSDTLGDLLADAAGSVTAAVAVTLHGARAERGWSSRTPTW
ncbi:MAG: hypothetical protein JWM31_3249 [Solirubrobacterales bacterium]|nr:hypothetical protein [Solirubrobacterales bacterium]